MNLLKYVIINIVETLIRVAPVPCKTGLVRIGNPGRKSPVFLTCNYHLTVERVKRALRGIDCYLLVANSGGDNVWCAATGGHLTNHDVISVVKTSGVEDLVDRREVILPQLAATGIETKVIQKKTGWRVTWGPVYAQDIPAFVRGGFEKSPEMRQVKFNLLQRLEMAVMWAFPFSVIATILILPFGIGILIPLNILIWGISMLVFLLFPLYSGLLNRKKKGIALSRYSIVFDLGKVPVALWLVFLFGLVVWSLAAGSFTWTFLERWGIVSLAIFLLLSIDLMGSTPTYKSGLHEDRFLKVVLDEGKCTGAAFCEQVCPTNCFEVNNDVHMAAIPRPEQCVQCGACIVQCPFDALQFANPDGGVVNPETVRTYKLNLLGSRFVKVG